MRYGSICSGIESATVAWEPLGWEPVFYSEIDPFCNALLAHRYPHTPNLGDFTQIGDEYHGAIDLLIGGTPCQSFSVAGQRAGLDDPRGNLALEFIRLAKRTRPRWLVWENVPGVLSSEGGRDFLTILDALGQCGYGFAYRILDAQYFGVPQRRRRVFVVGYFGDWRPAAAVLFERESVPGHPAPGREKREGFAAAITERTRESGRKLEWQEDVMYALTNPGEGGRAQSRMIAYGGNNTLGSIDVATAVNAHGGPHGHLDFESETFIAFDTTQITSRGNVSNPQAGDPCHPLASGAHPPAIAFSCKDHGADADELAPTLRAMGFDKSHANAGGQVAIAFAPYHDEHEGRGASFRATGMSHGLRGPNGTDHTLIADMAVRRLTPRECERLQGFPDDYTQIPYRNKPASDGPRYKALGNSKAVPVVRWIGERIELMESILKSESTK